MAAAKMTSLKRATKRYDASNSSAELVGSIDDLLTEILLRLPLKLLVHCELVSRKWHSMITKSVTPMKISKQSTTPAGLIVLMQKQTGDLSRRIDFLPFSNQSTTTTIPSLENIKSIITPYYFSIRQSCNGLLLISCEPRNLMTSTYYVCNPTTGKFCALPGVGNCGRRDMMSMWLAFDPVKSPYYKVVGIKDKCDGVNHFAFQICQIYIYSSDNRQWRPIAGQPMTVKRRFYATGGVYWNGNIHWRDIFQHGEDNYYLDMENEMLKRMPRLPSHSTCLGEYCVDNSVQFCDLPLDVYELRKDYSEWFIKFRLDVSILPRRMLANVAGHTKILMRAVIHGEDKNNCFVILESPRVIIRYNIVTKAYETLNGLTASPGDSESMCNWSVIRYIESLCSV